MSRKKSLVVGTAVLLLATLATVGILSSVQPTGNNRSQVQPVESQDPEAIAKKGNQLSQEGRLDEALTHFETAKALYTTQNDQLGIDTMKLSIETVKNQKAAEAAKKPNQAETVAPAPAYNTSR